MSSRPSRGAARLAAILDALPDALVLVNANGTVVNANTIALEAFETPGTALVGRGLLDLLPEFDSKLIPGSMRRPDHVDPARTKPTRMTARRTDGTEFPVEVTSANLENSQQTYDSYGYTGDELLMLVVRDLSGTVDTEAELARSQRQTEMILRAASEGVVGTDTDGRIVLVNPAAAQILGYRAGELGGRELHTLVLHSRADGAPFPYDESPLADTLRSGRKHRVRGQVLYAKNGDQVPVDLTTAPVRDGDQLVGAVMTFADRRTYDALVAEKEDAERKGAEELERLAEEHASELTALRQSHVTELEELRERHAEELAANEERYAALGEREKDRYEALAARHDQLLTLLGRSLRGPLDELRRELSALAADDAGQLWPEANQVLHHLSAGYARITTLIDNVLGYQQLDADGGQVARTKVMLDAVVAAGVDGAVELVGPGRVQFAVHAPPIEAEVEPRLLATALAHLVADVAGVDATGNTPVAAGGYLDNTVVVAAAQRGEVVRIEVRGPYGGGDPVHQPIVRGIVRAHGGVLQTHEVPGMSGSAYVLEVPIGGGAGAVAAPPASQDVAVPAEEAAPAEPATSGGRRRARRSSVDAFLESEMPGADDGGSDGTDTAPTGRRRRRAADAAAAAEAAAATDAEPVRAQLPAQASGGTGRRRGRPAEDATGAVGTEVELAGAAGVAGVSEGAVVTAAEHAAGAAASNTGLGGTVPPQGVPAPSGRRARHGSGEQQALPAALPAPSGGDGAADAPQAGVAVHVPAQASGQQQPTGRRRRALAAATERAAAQEAAPRTVFALPPAEADQEQPAGQQAEAVGHAGADESRHDAVAHDQAEDHTPPQPHPTTAPTGRRRRAMARPAQPDGTNAQAPGAPAQWGTAPVPAPGAAVPPQGAAAVSPQGNPAPAQGAAAPAHGASVPAQGATSPAQEAPVPPHGTPAPAQGAAVSPQGAAVPAHGGPVPAQGAAVPPHGGPVPAQSTAAVPPHDGPAPAQGAAVSPQGAAVPAHGGPVPAQGAAATPHGAAAPAPGASVPAQGAAVPPHGGPVPPHGGPVSAQGAAVPPQGAPVPAHGGPVSTQGAAATPHGAAAPAPGAAVAPHGGPVPAQGAAVPPHGGPVPAQGAAATPQGAAAPAPGASVPAQGAAVPPHGGPVPPHGGPVSAQGAAVPPQGVPAPAHGGPVPAQGAAATSQGAAVAPQGASAPGQGAAPAPHGASVPSQGVPAHGAAVQGEGQPLPAAQPLPAEGTPAPQQWPAAGDTSGAGTAVPAGPTPASGTPLPPEGAPAQRAAQPLPAEASAPVDPNSTQGRAISVRTLGQGVPFNRQAAQVQQPLASATPPPHQPGGSGRRRKLGTRPDPAAGSEQNARPHPSGGEPTPAGAQAPAPAQSRLAPAGEAGRSYAIGAPSADAAEGPEPLDGPGGAVEVADPPRPQPMDDELPPEPLDNPRRLLVWPAPDVTTQQALSDRGYRPVIVHSREEVDAQIAAFPAALFVDPLTGPITRTALQSLRQAAVAAEVPVLVTAGLGQASRDAAYGADPAVLLKALAPRDSEQHPPRVLLIEEHAEIALALTGTLERRGMQVARAASDADAVTLAGQFRPNLVVMDLMQVRHRQAGSAGIVDWLRANGQLTRTPLVVYTAAVDQADLPRLASGETVLFLAERSTSAEVQDRIVDLLSRIGTN
ncbi:PAS domain-containing protein [Streptomyces sp. SLBN-134]|uniref:PAS domain-containing protein n=1 Tax=Streptomyces sp. SLBN-134 TaxID=2768456 RepID=UPI0011540854|nr:PAS domain-containing protein [Streptomyces sp. SLBN-134]TQL21550.1 PAS domain S-box-containing protein [Streptomyces sp. SLBN-134]